MAVGTDATTGETLTDTKWDNAFNDVASALTQSISKDGQTQWTGAMNAGGQKITNLAVGAAANDSVRMSQISKKVIGITRDLSAASGNVAYTGLGFTPKLAFIFGSLHATTAASFGFIDFTNALQSSTLTALGNWFNSESAGQIAPSVGNHQTFVLSSADADGFTLTWTKTGTPTGTAQLYAVCFGG